MNPKRLTISNNEKLSLLSTLSTMITAGIPIMEAIDSIAEDSRGNTKKILESFKADLVQGKSLYAAFAKFPLVFNKVQVNVIKASEEAGTLDVVLKDLKLQIQKDIEFIDNIKSALAYPIIIFLLFTGVLVLILVVVIPKIATVFKSLRVDLPLPTKILIFMSNLIIQHYIVLIIALILSIVGIVFLYKVKKSLVFNVLFGFPFVSKLIKEIDIERFSRSMFLLLSSGLTITTALDLSKEVVIRKDISKLLVNAQKTIFEGKRLSEALRGNRNLFPVILIKIMEAGEKTGTLDKSMEEISNHMSYQVTATLKTVVSLLEPLMLIAVGFLVGGMMMSIIAPIYGLISQVGGK